MDYAAIETPTLLLNEARARCNIASMAQRTRDRGARFRPHFKTHQSAAIGEWFRDAGVNAITVSSVAMANYFADHGWRDITIAFPVNLRELDAMNRLAQRVSLGVLVDAPAAVDQLAAAFTSSVQVWIEIDAGYQRSGALWSDGDWLAEVAERIAAAPSLTLKGVLCHAGNTYAARTVAEVRAIHAATMMRMAAARETLSAAAGIDLQISIGDTPACSMLDDWGPADEVRPGNFVFYDLTQREIGACRNEDIAVAVACPVVGIYPRRHELVIYGGAIHLSKDSLTHAGGNVSFGAVALLSDAGWSEPLAGLYVRSVSQEHGVLQASDAAWPDLEAALQIGDLVAVLPVHSCLTANLLGRYLTLDGRWLEMAPIRG